MPFNFFAITSEGNARPVKRLRVSNAMQQTLTDDFTKQAAAFAGQDDTRQDGNGKEIEFDARYHIKSDDSDVFAVEKFTLPADVENAAVHPNQPDDLEIKATTVIKSIFAANYTAKPKRLEVYFQLFQKTRLLQGGLTLLFRGNTFQKLTDPGLTLDTRLVAIYDNGKLTFRSYSIVNQFLDLTQVFAAATDKDIKQIFKEKTLALNSGFDLNSIVDTQMRRQFSAVKESGVLKTIDAVTTARKAKKYGLSFDTRQDGSKKQLVFPSTKPDAKHMLDFLLEGYYEGELTGQKYHSNSHRAIKAKK